jgi:hypothetical protein
MFPEESRMQEKQKQNQTTIKKWRWENIEAQAFTRAVCPLAFTPRNSTSRNFFLRNSHD